MITAIGGTEDHAVTEVTEKGDGLWVKNTTVKFKDERADNAIRTLGWTNKRGPQGGKPPVWLMLHKA